MDNTESLYSRAKEVQQVPQRYYAFVETVDDYSDVEQPNQNRFFVRFDCIRSTDGQRFSSLGGDIDPRTLDEGPFSGGPFIHIECFSNADGWNEFFGAIGFKPQEAESQWLVIETRPTLQGIVANEFYNGVAMPVLYTVVALKATPEEQDIMDGLGSGLSLDYFPDSTVLDVENELAGLVGGIDAVMVANVGQGSMNCFFEGGAVTCYFDMGGGTSTNASTYPSVVRTCRTRKPPVILSHWDMDHIETAVRDTANCALPWIVPRQPLGLTHFTLALRISTKGRLHKWPTGVSWMPLGGSGIIKCTGTSKNDSGLAMIVSIAHGDILLPADSAYNHIPWPVHYSFSCLVASHHGAASGASHIPAASNKCWVVYSYGSDKLKWNPNHNSYGHPTSKSTIAHDGQGWLDAPSNRRDTSGGHVVFDNSNLVAGCGGGCSLTSSQHF